MVFFLRNCCNCWTALYTKTYDPKRLIDRTIMLACFTSLRDISSNHLNYLSFLFHSRQKAKKRYLRTPWAIIHIWCNELCSPGKKTGYWIELELQLKKNHYFLLCRYVCKWWYICEVVFVEIVTTPNISICTNRGLLIARNIDENTRWANTYIRHKLHVLY
jgi:hypothetical protein